MKNTLTFSLVAAVSFLTASQPLLAASKKSDPRVGALVAALQTVSPDPLGGRLGLAIAANHAPKSDLSSQSANGSVQTSNVSADERAYRVWKNAQKS